MRITVEKLLTRLLLALVIRLRRLVRPLDIVTLFDKGTFAVVMQHGQLEDCADTSYQRIHDGLALKNYQTRAGFLQPKIHIGACGAGAETGPPKDGLSGCNGHEQHWPEV